MDEVSLTEMLNAREQRVRRQEEIRRQFPGTLISFTMNIAGPVKHSPLIDRGFRLGLRELLDILIAERIPVLFQQVLAEKTGCLAFLSVDAPADKVKLLATQVEERSQLGRLFDMDVLDKNGKKMERAAPRSCLICGNQAQICARSRTHTVQELQNATRRLLQEGIAAQDACDGAALAQRALLYEVSVTPKPGLVDRCNSGSHGDMDFFTFQRSCAALYPYFYKCVAAGRETREAPPEETFRTLRHLGMLAEGDMYRATGGVNTHKGVIFSLGLLCGAMGRKEREQWGTPQVLLSEAAAMVQGTALRDFDAVKEATAETVGEQLYAHYGITGVRGQAAAGFPAVRDFALPKLENALSRGMDINAAAGAALMSLLAVVEDTNLIHRGSLRCQQEISEQAAKLLAETPFPNEEILSRWDAAFIRYHLSPGGCADMLALTLLLHFLKEDGGKTE